MPEHLTCVFNILCILGVSDDDDDDDDDDEDDETLFHRVAPSAYFADLPGGPEYG